MAQDEYQDDITGCTCIVSLVFIDDKEMLIDEYHTYGIVEEITEGDILRIRRADGTMFQLPYDDDTIEEAKPGEYKNKTTGEVVEDPDYIIVWDIRVDAKADIEAIKLNGYTEE